MTIQTLMDRGGKAKILTAWLYAAHQLLACPLPDGVRPTHRAVAHYARARLQVRWRWAGELIERAMWFSTRDVSERYQSNEDFVSVAKGRVRLAASLSFRGAIKALRWWARAVGQEIAADHNNERGMSEAQTTKDSIHENRKVSPAPIANANMSATMGKTVK